MVEFVGGVPTVLARVTVAEEIQLITAAMPDGIGRAELLLATRPRALSSVLRALRALARSRVLVESGDGTIRLTGLGVSAARAVQQAVCARRGYPDQLRAAI